MEIQNIPLRLIAPSPRNPRKSFDDDALRELADNIKQQGLLQPITIRPIDWDDTLDEEIGEIVSTPTKYEIVCGERRFRAFSLINADSKKPLTIPALVRDMSDDEAFDAMITENLQRKDVDPIEEAIAFRELVKAGQDCKSIALRFGKSERYVQDRMKLAVLTDKAVAALREERITLAGALMLAKLNDSQQDEVVKKLPETGATTAAMKTAISRLMCELDNAPFDLEREYEGFSSTCALCSCNTSNHGCLFYEMKGDKARCTNRECFEKKILTYASSFVEEHKRSIAKVNEDITCGKEVIVIDTNAADESIKKVKMGIYNEAKTSGFKVCQPYGEELSGRVFYDLDDERVKEGIEKKTMVLGWALDGYYRSGLNWRLVPYRLRTSKCGSEEKLSANEAEHRRVETRLNDLERQYRTKFIDELLECEKAYDFDDNGEMTDEELVAALRIIAFEVNAQGVASAVLGKDITNMWEGRDTVAELTHEQILSNTNKILRVLAHKYLEDRQILNFEDRRAMAEQYYRAADPDGCFKLDELHEEYDPEIEELTSQLEKLEAEEETENEE